MQTPSGGEFCTRAFPVKALGVRTITAVSRAGKRVSATLVAAILAVGSLGACGDSEPDTEKSSPAAESTVRESGDGGGQAGGSNEAGSEGAAGSDRSAFDPYDRPEVETPLKVSGGGSEQFVVEGGDNSIVEHGEEADESDLREAAEVVHGFYVARAAGEWSEACSFMSAGLRERLEQLASKSEVKGCAPFLEAFTTQQSARLWREVTTVDAVSLRQDGEEGFFIYRGARDDVYAMPLLVEDDEWKVTSLSATTLDG